MKKLLTVLLSIVFAVMLCMPLVACNNGEAQAERKRIIGIDSDKFYLKAKYYLKDQRDLNFKYLFFEILSYDKIESEELQGVSFDITTNDINGLFAASYELRDSHNSFERDGFYRYYVKIEMSMRWVTYEVQVNSITLNISDQEYIFSTDILLMNHDNQLAFIKPTTYGYTMGDPVKGPYSVLIRPKYDISLQSLNFQTDGFEILSYYIEAFNADTKEFEKIAEELPLKLEAERQYHIYVEAIPPQDCLYYFYEFEAVVELGENLGELSGIELKYTNIEQHSDGIEFNGSALNALNALD